MSGGVEVKSLRLKGFSCGRFRAPSLESKVEGSEVKAHPTQRLLSSSFLWFIFRIL